MYAYMYKVLSTTRSIRSIASQWRLPYTNASVLSNLLPQVIYQEYKKDNDRKKKRDSFTVLATR